MRPLEELQGEYDAACIAEDRARIHGYMYEATIARRHAATRLLHAIENPWKDCQCYSCADVDR